MAIRTRVALVLGCLLLAPIAHAAFPNDDDDRQDAVEPPRPFSVRFVDESGKPVAGVMAGVTAYFGGEGDSLTAVDESGWWYWLDAKSDTDGVCRFPDGGQYDNLCFVGRHTGRKLIAVEPIDAKKVDPQRVAAPPTVTLRPECRVSGSLVCGDLAAKNRDVGWTNVYLNLGERRAAGCASKEQTFHFFVPPGEYTLDAYGASVHSVERSFTIKPGQRELALEPIDLPARRLALLEGLPAPELAGVAGWKNSPGLTLAELKGRCVILDFWGYWCGPCVHGMPALFDLYDRLHDRGLEIVGVHVDQGEREQQPVDSADELDRRLSKVRKNVWKDRDVPYPVALIPAKRVPYGPKGLTREARCQAAADYGVTSYPTLVLIDREGRVVGEFEPSVPAQIERLEALLEAN